MTNPDPAQPSQPVGPQNSGAQPPAGDAGPGGPAAPPPAAYSGPAMPQPGAEYQQQNPVPGPQPYPQAQYGAQPYPQQGFPQQFPPPRQRGNTALWLGLGGAGALLLIVVVVVAGYLIFRDTDEDQIEDTTRQFAAAANRFDFRTMENLTCEARRPAAKRQREQWERQSESRREEQKRNRKGHIEVLSVNDVQVHGNTATARISVRETTHRSGNERVETKTDTGDFRKEGDAWKVCSK